MSKTHPTQRQRVRKIIADLRAAAVTADAHVTLGDIVYAAQNPPPEGGADGTLAEEEWTRARDIHDMVLTLVDRCEDFERLAHFQDRGK